MKLRPTLRDIANLAGVGKTTVSLSLRNDPRIPEATRRRVQGFAEQIGYRPDPVLSQIAAHRWRGGASSGSTIAFITTNHPGFGEPLDTRSLDGARRQAEAFGYILEHFRFEAYGDAERLAKVLFHRAIRGVIVGQLMRADFAEKFPWEHFSAVACNVGFFRPPINMLMPDHAHAIVQAWKRAEALGYERIGMALFDEGSAVDEFDKTSAALYCQSKLPRSRQVPVLHYEPTDHAAVLRWMKRYKPDVVFGFNEAVYWVLRNNGYAVPRDVAFAGLMLEPQDKGTSDVLAGLDYGPEILGCTALEHLDIMLRTNKVGIPERPSILMVEPKWQDGDTLPPKHKSGGGAASRR